MTTSADFLAYVLDQLAGLEGVTSRRMFGGTGLYCDEFLFGLIADDVLYLRVDDFQPRRLQYAELVIWARRSVAVAMKAPKSVTNTERHRSRRRDR